MTGPGGWRRAAPELVIAAVAVTALCAALYALAGAGAAAAAVTAAGAVVVVALRGMVPPDDLPPDAEPHEEERGGQVTFTGFWRTHRHVRAVTRQLAGYDYELRATLQHLLAARLSERHGISLYDDPEAARRLLAAAGRGGDQLWPWLDPARSGPDHANPGRDAVPGTTGGIPPRTLAAIIDRLERL